MVYTYYRLPYTVKYSTCLKHGVQWLHSDVWLILYTVRNSPSQSNLDSSDKSTFVLVLWSYQCPHTVSKTFSTNEQKSILSPGVLSWIVVDLFHIWHILAFMTPKYDLGPLFLAVSRRALALPKGPVLSKTESSLSDHCKPCQSS